MKKYIFGAVLSIGLLVSPAFTQAAGLTSSQVQAILSLLSSFGADQSVINNVQASLTGSAPTTGGQSFCHNFYSDLTVGSSGDDVTALNQALSLSGIDTTGNSSSFNENNAGDVVVFQSHYGIRQTGYVGPMTRTKLNALYGCHNDQQSTTWTTPTVITPTTQPTTPTQPSSQVVTKPSVSSVNPQSVQVGSTLTVYFTNGGSNGSVMLKTLDGSKSWFVPYTTGTVYNGFVYYDGSKVTFTVPSTIGAGQLPENSGYEAPIAITSGTYNLFVYSSGVSSTVFPITINTPSPTTTAPSGLTSTQIQSVQSILSSFGANSAAITNMNTILYGGTVSATGLAPSGLTSSQAQSVASLLSSFGANAIMIANTNIVLGVSQ